MITVIGIETGETEDVRGAFTSSREYIDAVFAKTNDKAKRQSIAGLAALLFLLRERGIDPSPLVLKREASGKPYFANSPLCFCISHSGGLAVSALSDSPVGIDVERLRENKNAENFSKRFFSARECAILTQAKDKSYAFFEIWTKKEAELKRFGRGVDSSLAELDTTLSEFAVFDIKTGGDDYIASVTGNDSIKVIGGLRWIRKQ